MVERGTARLIVYEFEAPAVAVGIELGKVCAYRLNYVMVGASAIQIVTEPR